MLKNDTKSFLCALRVVIRAMAYDQLGYSHAYFKEARDIMLDESGAPAASPETAKTAASLLARAWDESAGSARERAEQALGHLLSDSALQCLRENSKDFFERFEAPAAAQAPGKPSFC